MKTITCAKQSARHEGVPMPNPFSSTAPGASRHRRSAGRRARLPDPNQRFDRGLIESDVLAVRCKEAVRTTRSEAVIAVHQIGELYRVDTRRVVVAGGIRAATAG